MKYLITLLAIMFCLQSFGQDRNAQKRFEDSLMKAIYKQSSEIKKGGVRYYKELYDKTKKRVYLDSAQSVINRHRNDIDKSVMKRKQNVIQ